MTVDQFIAVMGAFTLLIGAVAGLAQAIHNYHQAVNGRMDLLLALTEKSAHAEGVLSQRLADVGPDPTPAGASPPTTPAPPALPQAEERKG